MSRHHGYWKSPCCLCDRFQDGKCVESNLRFKRFEVSKLSYVDLEVAVFFGEKGQIIKVYPSMKLVSAKASCFMFESWLNQELTDLTGIQKGITSFRCELFKMHEFD